MGNCLSTCASRTSEPNAEDRLICYGASKEQTPPPKQADQNLETPQIQSSSGKQVCSLVQKELELLQTHISHSQAVLAALKLSYFEEIKRNTLDTVTVHRTTQTAIPDPQPKSLENVSVNSKEKEWHQLTSSCPAIVNTANIAVQTEISEATKYTNDDDFFLPPIDSPLDFHAAFAERLGRSVPPEPIGTIDLDIYRSCRKLSVLPEEECESPPRSAQQAHSFESYLLPGGRGEGNVVRQLSDPTASRSTRRPLRLAPRDSSDSGAPASPSTTSTAAGPRDDSGLSSSPGLYAAVTVAYTVDPHLDYYLRVSSPESPYKTPPDVSPNVDVPTSSSDTSLSFRTPTDTVSGNASPTGSLPEEMPPLPQRVEATKPLLAVLTDDMPTPEPPTPAGLAPAPQTLDRVPSRRRLVRSLVRISSQTPIEFPFDEPSDPALSSITDGLSPEDKSGRMEKEGSQPSFPSLSEKALEQLGLSLQANEEQSDSQLTEEDIENKFTSLILAFKTDKLTLKKRLELQNRLRDQTELNMTNEVESLKSAVQLLEPICLDSEKKEIYEKICGQVEALHRSSLRVSSAAELYGAVQQENRLSKAVDVIQNHVENLKEAYEKEKSEHEETRKLLNANKATAATVAALKDKRRASIATLHRQQNQTENNSSIHNDLKLTRKGSQGRRLMNLKNEYILEQGLEPANVNSGPESPRLSICDCETRHRRNSSNFSQSDRLDNRRLSQQNSTDLDSESEEEGLKMEVVKEEPTWATSIQVRQKLRKRTSFHAAPWMLEIVDHFEWLRPLEDFALQARYSLAALLIIAAIGVISSGFIHSQDT